ncbi:MAG: sigma-70 family RNA polymerase sigma factor [Elusimicrobiota bacterium]
MNESTVADTFSLYLLEMGKVPLLTRAEEISLARAIENDQAELKALVLASPVCLRQFRNWAELIKRGEMDAKELMPRGTPSRAQIAAMRLKILSVASALSRGTPSQNLMKRIFKLGLHEDKIRRLSNRIHDQARRLREGKRTDPLAMAPARLLALDDRLLVLEEHIGQTKTRMLRANLRLVISIAKTFASESMDLADLIQEGSLGLIRAIDKFNWAKGFKFSTYATWWIRQSIQRALADKEKTIRIPVHVRAALARLKKASRTREQEDVKPSGNAPNARRTALAQRKLQELQLAMQEPLSLAQPTDGDGENLLETFLEDKTAPLPQTLIENSIRRDEVWKWLSHLDTREASVLRLRFGLDGGTPRSLGEVGRTFRVTRERVRQIQLQALAKLKDSAGSRRMRDYWS